MEEKIKQKETLRAKKPTFYREFILQSMIYIKNRRKYKGRKIIVSLEAIKYQSTRTP